MNDEYTVDVKALPLMIDTVALPGYAGVIGISSCPGMNCFSTLDLYDDRIENDLQSIRKWGASVVITLLELRELAMLGITGLPDRVLSMNMIWLHLPIMNMGLPDELFEESWKWAGPRLLRLLSEGQRIHIHCKEGVGRSGVVAARLLIEAGIDPDTAMKSVRKARPGSLMLNAHEEYCYSLVKPDVTDINAGRYSARPRSFSA